MDKFEVNCVYRGIIIKKNNSTFSIEKGADGDIWFNSNGNGMQMPISFYSREQEEWQCYTIFENLMKLIFGRFILDGDYNDEYSFLPKNFINLDDKTIIWHSDTQEDDILQLQLTEKEIIVSLTRDKKINSSFNNSIKVRIRTSGSEYGRYYQEFEKFYSELSLFVNKIELSKKSDEESQKSIQKKLSLFNKFHK